MQWTMNIRKLDEEFFESVTNKHVFNTIAIGYKTDMAINNFIVESSGRADPIHEDFKVSGRKRGFQFGTNFFVAGTQMDMHGIVEWIIRKPFKSRCEQR